MRDTTLGGEAEKLTYLNLASVDASKTCQGCCYGEQLLVGLGLGPAAKSACVLEACGSGTCGMLYEGAKVLS